MKKIVGIFIVTLLIATAVPTVGIMNTKSNDNFKLSNKATSIDVVWSDDFDSYSLDQFLDGTSDDGGWKPWNDIPSNGAYVVDEQFHSSPHSVEIYRTSDILHEFSHIRSGSWVFTDWVYVSSDHVQDSGIPFLSYYNHNTSEFYTSFAIWFTFDGVNDPIVWDEGSFKSLPLILDQWGKIQVEIDFEADWYKCYYNDELLVEDKWTNGWHSGGFDDGFLNLAAIDFYNYKPISRVYHDDMSIEGEATGPIPNLNCEGNINIDSVKPKSIVSDSFIVENIGEPNSRLEWVVHEFPDWGNNWTFQPRAGRLTPEDGQYTVDVSFNSPNESESEFSGILKVVAVGDPDDYYEIPITIKTSRNRIINNLLLEQLLSRFPILKFLI